MRGDMKVEVLSDVPQRFRKGQRLLLNHKPVKITRSREWKNGLVIALDAVHNRTQAEALLDKYLSVSQDSVELLPSKSYYHYEIIGIKVVDEKEGSLGAVSEILTTGGNDVYVVLDDAGKETLVPAIASVVLDVDTDAKLMKVHILPTV